MRVRVGTYEWLTVYTDDDFYSFVFIDEWPKQAPLDRRRELRSAAVRLTVVLAIIVAFLLIAAKF